jgi:TusA-related sulfurtransferase
MHDTHDPERLSVSATLVDSRGRACPLPIIDLAKALKSHAEIELWADDPAVGADVGAFCTATGHSTARQALGPGRLFRAVVLRKP